MTSRCCTSFCAVSSSSRKTQSRGDAQQGIAVNKGSPAACRAVLLDRFLRPTATGAWDLGPGSLCNLAQSIFGGSRANISENYLPKYEIDLQIHRRPSPFGLSVSGLWMRFKNGGSLF